MADGTVDSLNIQIEAEARSAEKSLNSLSNTLLKVNKNLQSSVGTIRKVSKEVGALEYAISSIGKININSSGINKTANALRRMFGAYSEDFDSSGFNKIAESIQSINNMPDVSNNVNRLVSSFARLANAGGKTGQSANGIFRLGQQVRLAADEIQGIGLISNDLNTFVQSIAKLASAGGKTGQTADGLGALANETRDFFTVMSSAPQISENTLRMTEALAQLASAGGRVTTATNTISGAFGRLSSSSGSALSAIKKVAKGIVSEFKKIISVGKSTVSAIGKIASGISSAFQKIGTSSKQVDTARFSLGSLLKTAIGFRLGYGLLQFGQQAFELGSAITEVENVVDVAFGGMADKAYEFASTATEQYGLSELAAKQYAGTMMAMLNSTGVAQDAAAEMSTTLAGLAGDLASFYNISTDEAFMKLRSAIAGETEPMRQLGVNMTVASLEAYALSQGITKSWQSMTQAEQAMLRYNYIMSATSQQQGDFARTVNSFANQWRILTVNVHQFEAVVGQGLIAAVLPAIQAINALFSVLMRAAQAFRDFMYVLTGYEGEGSQGGIVNEMAGIGDVATGLEDVGTSGGDAADGMDDATGAAQDLKKALSVLSFDELNQLSSAAQDLSDSLGDASGAGGGLDDINIPGTGLGDFGSLTDALGESKLHEAVNEWAERLRAAFLDHDWDRLGKEIAWGINKGLQAIYDVINWDNAKKKIIPFINGFTQTFNSLVDAIDWDLLGRTVGAGINTIVNSANLLMEGIDWVNLGRKFAEGINGLLYEVDWNNFGRMLGNYFMIAWDIFGGYVERLDFAKIGRSVAESLNGVFSEISFGDIAHYLATALNGVFDELAAFAVNFKWDDLVDNIVNGISTFIQDFEWTTNALKLTTFLNKLMNALADLAVDIPWGDLGNDIGNFIGTALGSFDWNALGEFLNAFITGLVDALRGIATVENFRKLGEGIATAIGGLPWIELLSTAVEVIKNAIAGLIGGIWDSENTSLVEKGILTLITGAAGLITISKLPIIGTLATKIVSWLAGKLMSTTAMTTISNSLTTLLSGASGAIKGLGEAAKTAATGGFKSLLSAIGASGAGIGLIAVLPVATQLLAGFVEKLQGGNGKLSEMGAAVNDLAGKLQNFGILTSEQVDEVMKIVDSCEDAQMSSTEMANVVMEKFAEWGISTQNVNSVLQDNNYWTTKTKESVDQLAQSAQSLGEGMSATAESIDLSSVSMQDGFKGIKDSLYELHLESDEFGGSYQQILWNLDQTTSSATTAQEAMDMIAGQLEAAGVPADEFITKMQKKFPQAMKAVKTSVDTNMPKAREKFASETGSMKATAQSDFSNIESDAENYFGGVNDTTVLNWGNSAEEVKLNLRAMKLAASEQLSAMTETVRSYSQSMYNIFTGKFEDIAEQIKREISSMDSSVSGSMRNMLSGMQNDTRNYVSQIANEFSRLSNQIARNMQGMYNVGRNAAVQFANGISSVHIPMPHITIDSSTWYTGSGYSYRMNSSVQWYKKGGLFMQPSVIGLAEAGKEAVLPLENRRTMSMIADSIMGNATTGMSEEALTNAVTAGVTMALMNNQGNQTPINLYATLYTEDNEVLARAVAKGQESIDYRYNPTPQFG